MENWKYDLRKALDGVEVNPSGLSIDDIIARTGAAAVPFWKRRHVIASVAGLLSAAAAVSIVVLTKDEPPISPAPKVTIADNTAAVSTPGITAPVQLADIAPSRRSKSSISTIAAPSETPSSHDSPERLPEGSNSITTSAGAAAPPYETYDEEARSNEEPTRDATVSMEEWIGGQATSGRKRKFRIGMDASGMTSSFSSSFSSEYDLVTSDREPESDNKGETEMSDAHTKGETVPIVGQNTINDDATHDVRMKFGISVSMSLNDRLSLVSGMTYSHQRSSIDRTIGEGTSLQSYLLTQTLDYVGIPLGLEYKLRSLGQFSISAYGGVAVEKMVRGRLWQDGAKNATVQSLTMRPLQWSATASAVLEYEFTDFFGIYFQPGVSFHLDNGSSIANYYGDNPVALDLCIGIRFSLFN